MINLINVSKNYNLTKEKTVSALKNVNLKLGENGLIFILGKSGSGKTTLLNLISGLLEVSSGEIQYNNKTINPINDSIMDDVRKDDFSVIFQEFNLLVDFNIKENILLGLEKEKISDEKVSEILRKVGLEGFEKRKVYELSTGQKQRVAIARALAKESKVILADEPTGSLDKKTSKQIFELLKEISKEILVIIVSHDSINARVYGDRVIEIDNGEVLNDEILNTKITSENNYLNNEKKEKYKGSARFLKRNSRFLTYFKLGLFTLFSRPFRFLITFLLLIIGFTGLGFLFTSATYDYNQTTVNEINYQDYNYFNISKKIYDGYQIHEGYIKIEELNKINEDYGLKGKFIIDTCFDGNNISFANSVINLEDANNSFFSISPEGFIYEDLDLIKESLHYEIYGKYPENSDEIGLTDYTIESLNLGGVYLFDENDNLVELKKGEVNKENLLNKKISINSEIYKITCVLDSKVDFYDSNFKYINIVNNQSTENSLRNMFTKEYIYGYPNCIFVSEELYNNFTKNRRINFQKTFPYNSILNIEENYINSAQVLESEKEISWFIDQDKFENNQIVMPSYLLKNYINENVELFLNYLQVDISDQEKTDNNYVPNIENNNFSLLKTPYIQDDKDYFLKVKNDGIFNYVKENIPENNMFFDELVEKFAEKNNLTSINEDLKCYIYFSLLTDDNFIQDNFDVDVINNYDLLFNLVPNSYRNIFGGFSKKYFDDISGITNYVKYFDISHRLLLDSTYYFGSGSPDSRELAVVGYYLQPDNDMNELIITQELYDLYDSKNSGGGIYRNILLTFVGNISTNQISSINREYFDFQLKENNHCLYININSIDSIREFNITIDQYRILLWIGFVFVICLLLLLSINFSSVVVSDSRKQIGIIRTSGGTKLDIQIAYLIQSFTLFIFGFLLSLGGLFLLNFIFNSQVITQTFIFTSFFIVNVNVLITLLLFCFIIPTISNFVCVTKICKKEIANIINDK